MNVIQCNAFLSGLTSEQVILSDSALNSLNKSYCRESGVRNLRKHIEKIYRKVAFKVRGLLCYGRDLPVVSPAGRA